MVNEARSASASTVPRSGGQVPGSGVEYYRKARLVARVLTSPRLRESTRWCRLAQQLVDDPGVTNRLIDQAVQWFAFYRRDRSHTIPR